MKMGIERVLKEKFGDAVKDVQQVYDDDVKKETTVEVSSFSLHCHDKILMRRMLMVWLGYSLQL